MSFSIFFLSAEVQIGLNVSKSSNGEKSLEEATEEFNLSKEANPCLLPKEAVLPIPEEDKKKSEEILKKFFLEKKRRGKPPKISYEEQMEMFEEHKKDFYDIKAGQMKNWEDCKNALEFLANKKSTTQQHIHLMAGRYGEMMNYVHPQLQERKKFNEERKVYSSSETDDDDYAPTKTEKCVIKDADGTWQFDIKPGVQEFEQDFKKSHHVKGLIILLRQLMWNHFQFPCNFKFDDVKSEECELHVFCRCPECKGQIDIVTMNKKKTLRIHWKDIDRAVKHTSTSYVTGEYKSKVLDMLKTKDATIVHKELANELMDNYDKHSPLLPSQQTLRQMKYRQNKKDSIYRNPHAAIAISMMKSEPEFMGCIEKIGLDPFFVYYMTPIQKAFLRSERRKKWIVSSIDATGISVQLYDEAAISDRTNTTKRVFLYSMALHGQNNSNHPIYQMIYQTHSSQAISEWLRTWKNVHNNGKSPNEIIIDQSAALLLSCIEVYTKGRSVHEYLTICYRFLFEGGPAPECFIRLDRSHIVRLIMTSKIFKKQFGKQTEPKVFYRRLMGFLLQQSDIKIVEATIRDVFILMYNAKLSQETLKIYNKLDKLTETHQIEQEYEQIIIKSSLFKVHKNIRIDRWLEMHLQYLQGRMKASANEIDDVSDDDQETNDSVIIETINLSESDAESDTDTKSHIAPKVDPNVKVAPNVEVKLNVKTESDKPSNDEFENDFLTSENGEFGDVSSENSDGNGIDNKKLNKKKPDPFYSKVKQENWMGQNDDGQSR